VLTDDDVIPHEDWLSAWRNCVDEHPRFGVFGGMIEIHWLEAPPPWIGSAIPLGIAFALTHRDLPSEEVDPRYVAGPNMAVRIEAIRGGLRFDEAKGPAGSDYAMGKDTAFAYAARARGYVAAHCSKAVVEHIVHPAQFERPWLQHRAYCYGQSRGLEDALADHDSCVARLMYMPRWMLGEYLKQSMLAAVGRLSGDTRMHVAATWEASYLKGYLGGYRREILKQKTES